MATAYTSSFSWSNGIAASGREGDRDRDRVRAGVSRSGFRSSRPTWICHCTAWLFQIGTVVFHLRLRTCAKARAKGLKTIVLRWPKSCL